MVGYPLTPYSDAISVSTVQSTSPIMTELDAWVWEKVVVVNRQ